MNVHHPFRVIAACVVLSLPLAMPSQALPVPHRSTTGLATSRSASASRGAPASAAATTHAPPRFAYYYIWFTRSSWRRAKSDRPFLGPYDSGDADVMRQHIKWAKAAGIDGFIVSWKHTPVLDERLATLVDIAEEEDFSLAIIYQGLDFDRNPLPATQIGAGLTWFDQHLATRAPFKVFDMPLVIWSGTWKFSADDIASVTSKLRGSLRILGSAKNSGDYLRIAGAVDGNAYYWSSVNPDTFVGYRAKLRSMADAVHDSGGIWVAPSAVGFDARKLGGKTAVDRKDGATFRTELAAAESSSPDLIGLISWNEFSENSHIEPSDRYGTCALGYVAQSAGLPAPHPDDCSSAQAAGRLGAIDPLAAAPAESTRGTDVMDSSSAGTGPAYGPYVAGGFALFLVIALTITVRRRMGVRLEAERLSDTGVAS